MIPPNPASAPATRGSNPPRFRRPYTLYLLRSGRTIAGLWAKALIVLKI
jgi:hypothetical protein